MTADQFRHLALSFAGVEEHAHHHHPDFRVNGKILGSLGYPEKTRAMVILTPEQQAEFLHDHPEVFAPAAGAWGRNGSTTIALPKATDTILQPAVQSAWQRALSAAATKKNAKKKKKPTSR